MSDDIVPNWEDIIHKNARTSDGGDAGNVIEIERDTLTVERRPTARQSGMIGPSIQMLELATGIKDSLMAAGFTSLDSLLRSNPTDIALDPGGGRPTTSRSTEEKGLYVLQDRRRCGP
jgi:hypothetical protein